LYVQKKKTRLRNQQPYANADEERKKKNPICNKAIQLPPIDIGDLGPASKSFSQISLEFDSGEDGKSYWL
jgi:hypothetical protein